MSPMQGKKKKSDLGHICLQCKTAIETYSVTHTHRDSPANHNRTKTITCLKRP